MDPEFWKARWKEGQIGFHQDRVHPDLLQWADRLSPGQRVLVPLCGKSHDLIWLAQRGLEVVGVELTETATAQLHREHNLTPTITEEGDFTCWRTDNLTVMVGDIFHLTAAQCGRFERIWDRAALVALAPHQRQPYVETLWPLLAEDGAILLNCFRYDIARDSPPHSVPEHVVWSLYGQRAHMTLLEAVDQIEQQPRWKGMGMAEFVVTTWWLTQR